MSALSGHDTSRIRSLFTRELRPSGKPKGAFLLLHGMESHSGWFVDVASQLAARGWAAMAFDRSGSGNSPGVRGHLSSYRDFVEETAGLASELRNRHGTLHLAGMSWGGMAALYLAIRRGWLFDSFTLLAPGIAPKKSLGTLEKFKAARGILGKTPTAEVATTFRPEDFTRDHEWRRFIDSDPLRLRRVTASFCLESLKMRRFIKENAGKRLLPPGLCLLGEHDPIVDNRRTADLCARAGVTVETMPGAVHTLIFDAPTQVVDRLARHADQAAAVAVAGKRNRVWIAGGGAVGGAVASLLSFQGVTTGLLVKPSHVPTLKQKGVSVQTGHGRRAAGGMIVSSDPRGLPENPDLVVVAVKSFDTPALLEQLKPALPAEAVLASLQNGLGNEDVIAEAFPGRTVVAGSICASLELAGPGHILWADDRGGIAGSLHRGEEDRAHDVWMKTMPRTGMQCFWIGGDKASSRLKWSKLMLNIGFNALNSITGLTSADLLRDDKYGTLAVTALREGFALMKRLSIEPVDLPGFPVSKLGLAIRGPLGLVRRLLAWEAARASEAAFSMRQDILRKKQHTEIDELNGRIAQIGRQNHLAVPANEKLVEMVKEYILDTPNIN